MARKSGRDKTRKPSSATQGDEARSHFGRWDWLLSFLLLISVADGGPFQMVRVLPVPADSVLTPESAWQPPLLSLGISQVIAECPYWLFAVVMSFLLSRFVRACFQDQRKHGDESGIELLILAALSLPIVPVDLATTAIAIGAAILIARPLPCERSRIASVSFTMMAVATVTLSVDFSIVLALLLVGWLKFSSQILPSRRIAYTVAGFAIALIGGTVCASGFAAAMARPITWSAINRNFLPTSAMSLDDSATWIPFGLTFIAVVHSWYLVWNAERRSILPLIFLSAFSVLAMTCWYYQWLALLGVISCSDYTTSLRRVVLPERLLRWSLVPIVLLSHASHFDSYRSFALTGHWPRQLVAPAEWGTSGRVMLMHPGDSSRWQTEQLRKSFKLLVDDRWDLFSDEYRNYELVCRDLSEFRSSRYLRSDGAWGGYRQSIDEWKPTLLVADSSDLDGIRRLSMSPDWNVVGIDAHRTILAAADEPKNASQIRVASRLLSELEWPSSQFDGSYGNVLAASSPSARLKVARALLAMRLPYAALRVMPEANVPADDLAALCYFEISHRVFRHTHAYSLLDQYRAVYHLRKLADDNGLSARQLIRVARGLEALDEPETAIEFATRLIEQSGSSDLQEKQWATNLIGRCKRQTADAAQTPGEDSDAFIRLAFRCGDPPAVLQGLEKLGNREREFFQTLADSIRKSPEDVYLKLIDQVNTADFPSRLRGEALFYLGSLAIEAGDTQSAVNAFSASMQASPSHPLNAISRVSLMNLQKGAR